MNDTISSRIRRIITGTAGSIVSKIEGLAPEAVLEQAIAEVDSALDQVKAELGSITAQKYHVSKAMTKLNEEHGKIEEQTVTAQKEGRKDLLEAAISRQIDIEDQLPTLESQLADLGRQEGELNQAIISLVAKRNEMDDELFDFKQAQKQVAATGEASAEAGAAPSGNAVARADRADRAFTRVLQDATGVRRTAIKASSEESGKLVELARLNKEARIEARLKALGANS
ncbi:PspA/IM30 family protein [Rubellicoccus peritrichatus]|uniref:PspA/IM30 family protein n=1 Tax=Rubellicoccus peritrichatus TaxID=3080537 RepID=A0AAQ3L8T8_9BACT|nr:PspA/IM30 family protein [Puniceicoccus sp. CR14]WOO40044.1 PspA/IM30 family protein [Puniceicoccus sp. CR14]